MARRNLDNTIRVRVDAQLRREIKAALVELQRSSPYSTLTKSEALRYLIKLGLAAGAEGYAVDAAGKLSHHANDEE